MSLIHEALKKASRDATLPSTPDQPRKIRISIETLSIKRLMITAGFPLLLLLLFTFAYFEKESSKGEGVLSTATPLRSADTVTPAANPSKEANIAGAITRKPEAISVEEQVRRHLRQGMDHFKEGKLAEADQEYQKALTLNQNSAVIHNNLGLLLKAQGRPKEALAHYQTALKLDPDYVPSLNNLGLLYDGQSRVEEAIRLYQKALHLAPDYAAAHLNYALLLERTGYQKEARLHYQAFLTHASHEDQQAISLVEKHLTVTP